MDEDQFQDESAAVYKAVADAIFKILVVACGALFAVLVLYVAISSWVSP